MFQKQPMMRRVLYSLVPVFLFSVYLYGWRVPVLAIVVFIPGILTEYFLEKTRKKKVSEAVLVTCALYTLAIPPKTPLWVAAIGIIFAVLLGKGVYGGFGRNVFNPAISGRLFIYITFPALLGTAWMQPGNFGLNADAVTSATPLAMMSGGQTPNLIDLFLGFRAGSMGESSILLILLAAIYLIYTKTANWRLMLSTLGSAAFFTAVFDLSGIPNALPTGYAMLSGSLLFVTVFMATDPVSAPKKKGSMWFYGIIIGTVTVLIRTFAGFPEGTSFGLLMGNVFASLIDEYVKTYQQRKKARGQQKEATT